MLRYNLGHLRRFCEQSALERTQVHSPGHGHYYKRQHRGLDRTVGRSHLSVFGATLRRFARGKSGISFVDNLHMPSSVQERKRS